MRNIHLGFIVIAVFTMIFSNDYALTNKALADEQIGVSSGQVVNTSYEQPVSPERNPPGDIPDSQVFVKYVSTKGGYELDVPEGWARKTQDGNVVFTSNLDGLSVTVADTKVKPDLQSIRKNQAEQLKREGRAVVVKSIADSRRKYSSAIRLRFESNSEPNPVTSKQVRQENEVYIYYHNGKVAELRLWAPLGADNIDQWDRISNSFRWR